MVIHEFEWKFIWTPSALRVETKKVSFKVERCQPCHLRGQFGAVAGGRHWWATRLKERESNGKKKILMKVLRDDGTTHVMHVRFSFFWLKWRKKEMYSLSGPLREISSFKGTISDHCERPCHPHCKRQGTKGSDTYPYLLKRISLNCI